MKPTKRQLRRAARSAALFLLASIQITAIVPQSGSVARADRAPATAEEERLEVVTADGTAHELYVEIARTPKQQEIGLMYRTSMAPDRGMLFPHTAPREATMWMRNTYISLDMIFILADGTIHRIEKNTQPLSERIIRSNGPVAAVLELVAGSADRLGLKPGDQVKHPDIGRNAGN